MKLTALGNDFRCTSEIILFPNPSSNFFNLSQDVVKADVYSVTGQLVKSFERSSPIIITHLI
jgi:hypothetical protein